MQFDDKELNIILGALNCYSENNLPEDIKSMVDSLISKIKRKIKKQ